MENESKNTENYACWVKDDRQRTLDEIALMVERRYKQWTLPVERECLGSGIKALSECAEAIRGLK